MDYPTSTSFNDTAQAAKNAATDAVDTVKSEASDMADQAQQSASKIAGQVQQAGSKAADATRAYAKDAVDSSGRKVRSMKSQLEVAKANATEYINNDPVRAVKIAAISGGLLTALLIGLTYRSR